MVVVLAALILVRDHECDRRAGGFAFEYAAEHLHGIAFLSLRYDGALSRSAPVEFVLDEVEVEIESGRTAIHDAADGRAVGFTESSDAEEGTECIHCATLATRMPRILERMCADF